MALSCLMRSSLLRLVAASVGFVQMASAAPAFTPLALGEAANTGFSDTQPEDQKGGWTDQGNNDLRVLSAGKLTLSGVPFTILDENATPGKTCIVLGGPKRPYLPSKAAIPVPNVRGNSLYLLHAAAWCPPAKDQKMTGVLFVDYSDGSSAELHVRFGRDVGNWASPDSFKNAARVWTAYNANTQVSLFLSRFPLKPIPVKAIRLESRASAWMIAAASIGDEVALKPLKPVLEVTKQFVSPPPFDKPLLDAPADAVPKNIILIIGDGMGQGALKLTSLHQHKAEGRLLMQQLPVSGFCTTRSASSEVTDSAAASTAMATGCKTANTFLGITPDKQQQLTSFAEVAQRGGRAIGLITSDSITGATPAGFYAHEASRGFYQGVAEHAAASGFDVLIGNSNGKAWFLPKAASGQRTDARDVLSEMSASGYAVVSNLVSFAQAPHDKKILGFMSTSSVLGKEQILGQLAETALERLAKNDKGFFLMVECTITDAGGHSNTPDVTVLGTTQVDWAVRSAVAFARTRGDTLVLVTADHETGGLTCGITNMPSGKLVINYSTTSHTSAPVRLFAYGPGSQLFKDTVDNTDIAKNICRFWQLTLPAPIPFNRSETKITRYPDGRPSAAYRLEAKDHGVVLKHGDGPGKCDILGARDVWVYEDKGTYYMHYDGAGPKGWLCCLATSTNLVDWVKKGPVLDFGKPGEEDSASASYGVTYFDGTSWHMYYLGTPNVSPAPDLIPSFPYLTMKAKGASAAGPWTKQPEVVPFRIKPGTYYSATASPGHIIKQGDDYLMFFSASTHNPTLRTLSIARTRDLNGPWTVDATPIVPLAEQIENSSLYFEPANQTWFLFTNHIGLEGGEYTDAVWVYWTKDLNTWNAADKAVVLDGRNCAWSRTCIGLPSVLKVGNRLAIIYDGPGGTSKSHMKRDVGLAWLELPLIPRVHPK